MDGTALYKNSILMVMIVTIPFISCDGNHSWDGFQMYACHDRSYLLYWEAGVSSCFFDDGTEHESRCNMELNLANGRTTDLIPVTDTSRTIAYKNIHCALCNRVQISTITIWRIEIQCASTLELKLGQFEDLLNVVFKTDGCRFHLIPTGYPSHVTLDPLCYLVADHCNVTAALQNQISGSKHCWFASPYYVGKGLFFYRNACARCNGVDIEDLSILSDDRNGSTTQVALSFSVPLNYDSDNSTMSYGKCGPEAIIDDLHDGCVEARCSLIRRLQDNECTRVLETMNILTYKFGVRLSPSSSLKLQDAIEHTPSLNNQLLSFLEPAFGDFADYEYEIIFVPDLAHEDWNNAANVKESFIKFIQLRFKLKEQTAHDPEETLAKLINASSNAQLVLNKSDHNIMFSITLQDFIDNTVHRDPWEHCSPILTPESDISLCKSFNLSNALETSDEHDIPVVRYVVHKATNQSHDPAFDTWSRSILEYRACPFVEVFRNRTNWKEVNDGLFFKGAQITIPFDEFIYGNTTESILVCKNMYFQLSLYRDSSTAKAACPLLPKGLLLFIGFIYFKIPFYIL